MSKASSGLQERLKKTIAISRLGQGMDVGSLNEYSHQIALYLLLKVFYREINNNQQRTKRDLVEITAQIIKEMELNSTREQIVRLVDGILYAGDPRQQSNFTAQVYDEVERDFKKFNFRYLIPDREASNWMEGGHTVYRLSDIAQEIIFITREILQEFGFDLEQFYTLQLIKNGNFSNARDSVSNLIARVRNLIKKEKDWREDILRNPALIFSSRREGKKPSEGELKDQFEEEKKVFADMFTWRDRLDNFPAPKKKEGELLFEELERARALHDRLAELAISNLSLEIEIRKNNPDIFWKSAQVSFKKDFWQNTIMNSGLPDMELLNDLLNPLFSPAQDFIYPLDWAWSEQQSYSYTIREEEKENEFEEKEPPAKEINWDLILDLWESIFEELREKGEYHLNNLTDITQKEQKKWLSQEKNLELFMMFIITDIKLIEIKQEFSGLDERLLLFNRLLKRNNKLRELIGKKVTAVLDNTETKIKLGPEFVISPYILYLEDE